MAPPEGLEPPTTCLEGRCSIQLSYGSKKMERVMGIEPTQPAWKAGILPLNNTRIFHCSNIISQILRFVNSFSQNFLFFYKKDLKM